jgi:hypothetical protein
MLGGLGAPLRGQPLLLDVRQQTLQLRESGLQLRVEADGVSDQGGLRRYRLPTEQVGPGARGRSRTRCTRRGGCGWRRAWWALQDGRPVVVAGNTHLDEVADLQLRVAPSADQPTSATGRDQHLSAPRCRRLDGPDDGAALRNRLQRWARPRWRGCDGG